MAHDDSWIDAEELRIQTFDTERSLHLHEMNEWECRTCLEFFAIGQVPVTCARKGHDVRSLLTCVRRIGRDEEFEQRHREMSYWLSIWEERRSTA